MAGRSSPLGRIMQLVALLAPAVILLLAVCYDRLLWVMEQAFSKAGQPGAETVASVATGSVFSSALANTAWLTAKVLMVIERSLSLCPDWAVASSMGLLLLVISGFALLVLYGAAARVRHLGWAASDEEPEPSRPTPLAGAFMQAGPSIPWCGALPCRHAPHPHRAGAGC